MWAEGNKAGTEGKNVTLEDLSWASEKGQTWHRLGQADRTAVPGVPRMLNLVLSGGKQ